MRVKLSYLMSSSFIHVLQMTEFPSSWLNGTPLCICTTFFTKSWSLESHSVGHRVKIWAFWFLVSKKYQNDWNLHTPFNNNSKYYMFSILQSKCTEFEVTWGDLWRSFTTLLAQKTLQNHAIQEIQIVMFTLRTLVKLPKPTRICISEKPPSICKISL